MDSNAIIRKSVVSGSFYPRDPGSLTRQIEEFLSKVKPQDISDIRAIVSPHAGYIYSGQVAAYSFRQIQGKRFDSIIIIAPSHAEFFDYISAYHGDAYETPLGLVMVDRKRILRLMDAEPVIRESHSGHGNEHSLEVQLPFLQTVMKQDIKIIPLVMGNQSPKNIKALGEAIGRLFAGEDILIIASTDLSHYHPYDTAVSMDTYIKDLIESFDSSRLINSLIQERAEMCGGGPVASAMIASRLMGADSSIVLNYANSGDITGDRSAVVGYLSAAFFKTGKRVNNEKP